MHLGNNWLLLAEGGGREFHVLLLILAVSTGLLSSGRYAIDNLAWMKTFVSFRSSTQTMPKYLMG